MINDRKIFFAPDFSWNILGTFGIIVFIKIAYNDRVLYA